MNQNNQVCYEEDEIDLRELFKTIWNYKKFIFIFTTIITIIAVIYAYSKKPVYEIEPFIELGYYNSNSNSNIYFIDPNNAIILLQNSFSNVKTLPILKKVSLKRGTNLLDLEIDAYSNDSAKNYLDKIITFLKNKENKKVDLLLENVNLKIKNLEIFQKILKAQLKENKRKLNINLKPSIYQALLNNINTINNKIFNINQQIANLKMSISPLNVSKVHIIGKIKQNDYPIKPKKKLIIIVAFITSFILAIFLVFFIEFIRGIKEEEK